MATGVLASGLETVGVRWAAEVMLALAALSWLLLAALFAVRLGARAARRSRRWAEEADTPASLTGVAATSVLGTGFALLGAHGLATALLALAALLWPRLLPDVLWHERHRGLPGAAYLVCVATQSLVVLGCTLAAALGWGWVLWPAAALLLLGLLLYALVLARFDFRQLRIGPGDHWVACGAVSISALAAAKLTNATALLLGAGWRHTAVDVLQVVTGVLIGVALAWYAVLVCCEVRWPRPRYEVRRWSTVFPLGMTALAAMVAGTVLDSPALRGIGRALLGPALVVWAAVAVGLVRAVAAGRASR
jgi:tellurite resistance protein TehA-like permease